MKDVQHELDDAEPTAKLCNAIFCNGHASAASANPESDVLLGDRNAPEVERPYLNVSCCLVTIELITLSNQLF